MNSTALCQPMQDNALHHSAPHIPVMEGEVLSLVSEIAPKVICDGTCGAGGHASALLREVGSIERYFCVDWDSHALEIARDRLAGFGDMVEFIRGNYAHIPDLIAAYGIELVDCVLLDLGISSMHLETSGRGFSFLKNEPLDMRMDDTEPYTVLDLIRETPVEQLAAIIREFGEERWAGPIAKAIKEYCHTQSAPTSKGLAEAVKKAIPRRFHPRKIHPATRTFQALRIALNRELDNLKLALQRFPDVLRPGGRFIVISFHSLEDRLVKHSFRNDPRLDVITKRPLTPSEYEKGVNPRARSAKLRCAQRRTIST